MVLSEAVPGYDAAWRVLQGIDFKDAVFAA
jgi:hypothetical protein